MQITYKMVDLKLQTHRQWRSQESILVGAELK
jgi:hypothetical protein